MEKTQVNIFQIHTLFQLALLTGHSSILNIVVVNIPANNLTATCIWLPFTFLIGIVVVVICRIYGIQTLLACIMPLLNEFEHIQNRQKYNKF